MKKIFFSTMVIVSAMMMTACSTNNEVNESNSFTEVFDFIDSYVETQKTGGRDAADRAYQQFWENHPEGSLPVNVTIDEGLDIEIESYEIRPGTGTPFDFQVLGLVKKTSDVERHNKLRLICYKNEFPVNIFRVSIADTNDDGKKLLMSTVSIHLQQGKVPARFKDFNRVVLTTREIPKELKHRTPDGGYILNATIGPIYLSEFTSKLPEKVDKLYDKIEEKQETHEDMDGEWTENYLLCTLEGKPVLRIYEQEGRVGMVQLLENCDMVETEYGLKVGMSARELFSIVRAEWNTIYDGTVFAKVGGLTFHINSEDLINVDTPKKVEDIREDAKVVRIDWE